MWRCDAQAPADPGDPGDPGYCRIQGEMKKLGHKVAKSTIGKALKDSGVPPSPKRPTSWRTFLRAHAGVIAASDFFTVDSWTPRGLVTHYVLFVIHHVSRLVEIAGVTTSPDAASEPGPAHELPDTTAMDTREHTDRPACLRRPTVCLEYTY